MKFLANLEKQKSTWFLIVVSFFFFLLRLPSLFEPYWYGDEGIYEVIGSALRQGRQLYSGIWDNKPPLLYYLYAIFSGDQQSVRLFSLVTGLLSVIVFYYLSEKIIQKKAITYTLTLFFAFLFGTPLLEGNIANAENFMILPILIAALLIFLSHRSTHKKTSAGTYQAYLLFSAGFLTGIAVLIKIVAIFDFAAFFIYIFLASQADQFHVFKQLKNSVMYAVGCMIPLFGIILYFILLGNIHIFLTSVFFSNIAYVDYRNSFIIPHGLLLIKLFLLLLVLGIIIARRKHIPSIQKFVYLWFLFSLFNAFFSQRPYTHYVLTLLVPFLLLIGTFFLLKKMNIVACFAGLVFIFFISNNFQLHPRISKSLFGYYGNILSFMFQKEDVAQYLSFFDTVTPRDYAIASYINSHRKKNQSVFIWGDNAQLYKLTDSLPPGRFMVAYHIVGSWQNILETNNAINQKKPEFIILLPKQSVYPYNLSRYQPRITISNAVIYEKIF